MKFLRILKENLNSVRLKDILGNEYGDLAAEKIIYKLGRAAGLKDAEDYMKKFKLEKGNSALAGGPVNFALSGWAKVNILPETRLPMNEDFFMIYEHPFSFESNSYLNENIKTERPVCFMNAGYSSGWCQTAFGVELIAKEIFCKAKGDDKCIFVMSHPSMINRHVIEMKEKYSK